MNNISVEFKYRVQKRPQNHQSNCLWTAEGLAEARAERMAEARAKRMAEGKTEGEHAMAMIIAKKALQMGMNIEAVAELTGLSEE
ncbi:MAG: hypothetical protein FWD64_07705, partial [Acidobacteriaceae bacterium]|nr:hypothetical protein [Acidobacteriaceae bacterium]